MHSQAPGAGMTHPVQVVHQRAQRKVSRKGGMNGDAIWSALDVTYMRGSLVFLRKTIA
jgi:hypothetical protein